MKFIKMIFNKIKEYHKTNSNQNLIYKIKKDCKKIGIDLDILKKYIEDSKK